MRCLVWLPALTDQYSRHSRDPGRLLSQGRGQHSAPRAPKTGALPPSRPSSGSHQRYDDYGIGCPLRRSALGALIGKHYRLSRSALTLTVRPHSGILLFHDGRASSAPLLRLIGGLEHIHWCRTRQSHASIISPGLRVPLLLQVRSVAPSASATKLKI